MRPSLLATAVRWAKFLVSLAEKMAKNVYVAVLEDETLDHAELSEDQRDALLLLLWEEEL